VSARRASDLPPTSHTHTPSHVVPCLPGLVKEGKGVNSSPVGCVTGARLQQRPTAPQPGAAHSRADALAPQAAPTRPKVVLGAVLQKVDRAEVEAVPRLARPLPWHGQQALVRNATLPARVVAVVEPAGGGGDGINGRRCSATPPVTMLLAVPRAAGRWLPAAQRRPTSASAQLQRAGGGPTHLSPLPGQSLSWLPGAVM
jgi:hypothetical protein